MFVIGNLLNFALFVPPVFWATMDLQTGLLEDRDHARIFAINIIHYYELFSMDAGLNSKGTKAIKMVEK